MHDAGRIAFKLGSKYERLFKLPNLNAFSMMVRHLSDVYYFLSSLEEYETGKCQHFHLAAFPLKDGTGYLWIMQKAHFTERFCPTFKDIYLRYSNFDPLNLNTSSLISAANEYIYMDQKGVGQHHVSTIYSLESILKIFIIHICM